MNQTKKRLSIIKLAISITDIEAIQLQILKLSPLKTDEKIQEIIAGLQAENYAQTQALITTYIETPMEEILQRTAQKEKQLQTDEEIDIIEEFDLFITSPAKQEDNEKKMFDIDTLKTEQPPKRDQEVIDYDALLNIEAADILPDNIKINNKFTSTNSFFDETKQHSENTTESHIDTSIIPKDTFFETEETPTVQKEEVTVDEMEEKLLLSLEKSIKEDHTNIPKDTFFDIEETHRIEEIQEDTQTEKVTVDHLEKESIQEEPAVTSSATNTSSQYEHIPYIDQKFKNMYTQYPPVEESDENFTSVHAWLLQISNDGYSNEEMEEIIKHIEKLTESNSLAEAAQLLLISGATKSKFAQFILARALYKGKILQKNLPEAFTLINRLAMDDDYPEAICDLGQFYEHGIGINKDKKRAELLYREAMDLDIQRAVGHYERVRKQNSSFFSAFKR